MFLTRQDDDSDDDDYDDDDDDDETMTMLTTKLMLDGVCLSAGVFYFYGVDPY